MEKSRIESILAPVSDKERSEREAHVRRSFWAKLKRVARKIPFVEDLVAAYYCALDPNVPVRARGILLAALAYFILPFDFLPDIILGIGFTDDMAVLMYAISTIRGHMTDAHYAAAKKALAEEEIDIEAAAHSRA
ncbi:YkvA family protein [Notoacmeibacter sp. MSK16QG-6]|uniref:YkvA family protein n=1 Tax=Notoacmeibacter sp. MSK16QG-6 TaxID=2957982 RepID=UPI0020A0C27A|nr:YkvA family protein [Notoacmeibacter sp. MSK16QG-6]MCP1199159.1 YkvA family protein [Notoacmeibacter sp. MSK16QG-6]